MEAVVSSIQKTPGIELQPAVTTEGGAVHGGIHRSFTGGAKPCFLETARLKYTFCHHGAVFSCLPPQFAEGHGWYFDVEVDAVE
jgi:hypothetical protein